MTELLTRERNDNTLLLNKVTVSIFTKDRASNGNYQRCISSLRKGIKTMTFEGSRILFSYRSGYEAWYKEFNFARNCNKSAELAETEWILLLNDDCFLFEGCIQEMLRIAEKTDASIVGAKLFFPNGRVQHRGIGHFPRKNGRGITGPTTLLSIHHIVSDSEEEYSIPPIGVTAACMLVKTKLLRKVPFDQSFKLSWEDTDFCLRAKNAGAKIVVANRACGIHVEGASSSRHQGFKKRRSVILFYKRYPQFSNVKTLTFISYYLFWEHTSRLRVALKARFPSLFKAIENKRKGKAVLKQGTRTLVPVSTKCWEFGGGTYVKEGWLNVDIASNVADFQHDLRIPFPKAYRGTVEKARFFHGPEHYSKFELPFVLQNISQVLAPNGELEIRCPDMDYLAKAWLEQGPSKATLGGIFGSHENEFQVHKNGLNFDYLKTELEKVGFVDVRRVEPASTYSGDINQLHDLHILCIKRS